MPFADSTTPPPLWAVGSSGAAPPPPDPEADPRTRGSEPDPHDWARQIVLRQLTATPRSRAQLEQALRRMRDRGEIQQAWADYEREIGAENNRLQTQPGKSLTLQPAAPGSAPAQPRQ